MDKKTRIVVGIIILLVVAAIIYVVVAKPQEEKPPANTAETTKTEPNEQKTAPPAEEKQKGTYIDYSPELIGATKGTKLLFFHAPWCPQCKELDASIKSSALLDNLTIFKVDYDSNQALRQKYGVTLQTTIVKIDDNGNKVASYVAYEAPNFAAVQQALLP